MKRLFLLYLVVVALPACHAIRYSAVKEEDTAVAYRGFLASFPKSEHGPRIRERLEALDFKAARTEDRPIAYRMYLERYPSGRYAQESRRRLGRLGLARAKTVADLRLIMEQFEGSPEGAEARKRLPAAMAAQVLASGDEAVLQAFIREFPGVPESPKIKQALAGIRYSRLSEDRFELETFARNLAGTPEAAKARQRARILLEGEVESTGFEALFRELQSRYPRSARLPELQALVRKRRILAALTTLDLKALAAVRDQKIGSVEISKVLASCHKRPKLCGAAVEAARDAMPWRPAGGLAAQRAAAYGQDLLAAWGAVEALGWAPDEASASLLLELLGSARLSTIRLAGPALDRWAGRAASSGMAARWLRDRLRRPPRRGNDDETQRYGALLILAGQEQKGRRLLNALTSRPGRILSSGYLLASLDTPRGKKPSADLLSRFIRAADGRLKSLEEGFPSELNNESGVAALIAEREVFSLVQALTNILASAGPAEALSHLHVRAADTLARWQMELGREVKLYRRAEDPSLKALVNRHEQGRAKALKSLLRGRNMAGKAAAMAICQLHPIPTCKR